jgi:hypothetical protein
LRFWNSHLRPEKQFIRDSIWSALQARAPHPLPDYCAPGICSSNRASENRAGHACHPSSQFPLTPALSQRERENHSQPVSNSISFPQPTEDSSPSPFGLVINHIFCLPNSGTT